MSSAFATMKPASSADSSPAPLKYQFINPALLNEALTHRSQVNERKSPDRKHNERLEFLGDAVLSLIISDYLATRYPQLSEGALSKLKAKLVSEVSLARAARRLDLGARLQLGRGEELSKGREKTSLLADALEAVIAAVYLDGGLEASRNFTLDVLAEELMQIDSSQAKPGGDDYKTRFQEWCQKRYELLPRYVTVRETGPDHQKVFEVEVQVDGRVVGAGQGRSKKEAEQVAAQRALEGIEP
ncbi:MAG TPA: ribonuclease III [Nitrospiraceae bacterium]|nr:ribonuclease III [Nitrospiraceae bacterium]